MSEFDIDAVIEEHRTMCLLLMQAVEAMRITQRLFELSDGHMLMSKCREIEEWLDAHQATCESACGTEVGYE